MRFHHNLVVPPIDRDKRVVADQFGGVDLTADRALFRVGDTAVLGPNTGHSLGDLPLYPGLYLSPVGLEACPLEAAMDDIHRRRPDELRDEQVGRIVVDFGR